MDTLHLRILKWAHLDSVSPSIQKRQFSFMHFKGPVEFFFIYFRVSFAFWFNENHIISCRKKKEKNRWQWIGGYIFFPLNLFCFADLDLRSCRFSVIKSTGSMWCSFFLKTFKVSRNASSQLLKTTAANKKKTVTCCPTPVRTAHHC